MCEMYLYVLNNYTHDDRANVDVMSYRMELVVSGNHTHRWIDE
jgi:hypothetical protein